MAEHDSERGDREPEERAEERGAETTDERTAATTDTPGDGTGSGDGTASQDGTASPAATAAAGAAASGGGEPSAGGRPGAGTPGAGSPGTGKKGAPLDEEAAWAAIVAGYGAEPPDPPGAGPFRTIRNLALPEPGTDTDADAAGPGPETDRRTPPVTPAGDEEPDEERPAAARPVGSSVAFAPGVGGPRDYSLADPPDDASDEDDGDGGDDEGHFVPPEPPSLPEADVTAKFAWLGVLGGPVLLLLAVLLGWEMTWWLQTVGIGGFLGGFVTLVARMNPGDEDDDDPGRGAVV